MINYLIYVASCLMLTTAIHNAVREYTLSYSTAPTVMQYPRHIQLSEDIIEILDEEQINAVRATKVNFMDVTNMAEINTLVFDEDLPTTLQFQTFVRANSENISKDRLKSTLKRFSEFHNRYFKSTFGLESQKWLLGIIKEIANNTNPSLKISVTEFSHEFPQSSIIARIESNERNRRGKEGLIILSAHQDSQATFNPLNARAPGADDDGSGSITLLEIFRIISSSNEFIPERPLEFHWYAAEEVGLLGSRHVAEKYREEARLIYGVLHFDMTGYNIKEPNAIGVVTDYVDLGLTKFMKSLIAEYLKLRAVETKCGYACSDHASWTKRGYRSTFPFEGRFENLNPNVHSDRDVLDLVDYDHMQEFVKLGIAFAFEMAQKR